MRNRSASGANVRFHTFVFFPQQSVEGGGTRQSLRACTVRTSYLPDVAIALCRKAPKANTTPPPLLFLLVSPLINPRRPASPQPSLLSFSPHLCSTVSANL